MIKELVKYFDEQGTKSDLAKSLGITKGAVSQWNKIPAAHVLDVERITGISRHVLRPDIFGAGS